MTRKRNIADLSLERLREVLGYDPATGHLTWRVRLGPMCKFSRPAGVIKLGYRKISIDGRNYAASHLAWFHFYGIRPTALIDHKNSDKDDNRIENLREATHCQNSQNVGVRSNNSAGLKGASQFNRKWQRAKYRSSITVNKKRIFLGLFMTAEEAHAAYCKAAAELHGEFANLGLARVEHRTRAHQLANDCLPADYRRTSMITDRVSIKAIIEEHVGAYCDDERCKVWLDGVDEAADAIFRAFCEAAHAAVASYAEELKVGRRS